MKRIILVFIMISTICIHSLEINRINILKTGNAPKSVNITPEGKYAYINNLEDCSFWIYDTDNKSIVKKVFFNKTYAKGYNYQTKDTIHSSAEKPVECDFAGNGYKTWISLHNAGSVVLYDESISVNIRPEKFRKARVDNLITGKSYNIELEEIKTGKTPKIVKSSPDGKWIYVANWFSNNVSVINTDKMEKIKDIKVMHIPRGIDFSPDGKYAYILNMGASHITVIDVLNDHSFIKNLYVGVNPRHICISSDGKYAYITLNIPGNIVKYDLENEKIIKTIHLGERARSMVLSIDNNYAFVLLYDDNEMAIVRTLDMEIVKMVKTGLKPIGIDITPDGRNIWVTNYFESTVYVYELIWE